MANRCTLKGLPDTCSITPSSTALPVCHLLILDDEARQKALLDPPDFGLADFRLRGRESGIKAIREWHQQCPNLPALLFSGDTAEDRWRDAQDAGLQLLHKPLAVHDLLDAIFDHL